MQDYLNISSCPSHEDCAQAGMDNQLEYEKQAKKECQAFIDQLRRIHGPEPFGSRLAIKGFPHDGCKVGEVFYYYEVICYFPDTDDPTDNEQKAIDYAFLCEADLPRYWDEIALKELNIPGNEISET